MTRYLLDTNIVSNPTKQFPSRALEAWMSLQSGEDLFICSWSLAEVWHGILLMPVGKKRAALEEWYFGPDGPIQLFYGRILDFDTVAAHKWAELVTEGRNNGRSRSLPDMIVASIAIAHNCTIVTDNERHFWGLDIVNPMAGEA